MNGHGGERKGARDARRDLVRDGQAARGPPRGSPLGLGFGQKCGYDIGARMAGSAAKTLVEFAPSCRHAVGGSGRYSVETRRCRAQTHVASAARSRARKPRDCEPRSGSTLPQPWRRYRPQAPGPRDADLGRKRHTCGFRGPPHEVFGRRGARSPDRLCRVSASMLRTIPRGPSWRRASRRALEDSPPGFEDEARSTTFSVAGRSARR